MLRRSLHAHSSARMANSAITTSNSTKSCRSFSFGPADRGCSAHTSPWTSVLTLIERPARLQKPFVEMLQDVLFDLDVQRHVVFDGVEAA